MSRAKGKKSRRNKARQSRFGEGLALGLLVLAALGLGLFALTRSLGSAGSKEWQGGLVLAFGVRGEERGQFSSPRGIAVGSQGYAVADPGRDKVLLFSFQGVFVDEFGGDPASKPYGVLVDPHDVDFSPQGDLAVADPRAVRIFSPEGKELKDFDGQALGLYSPRALAATPDGGFLVADTGNGRVAVISPAGEETAHFTGPGDGLLEPKGLASLKDGNIAVTDRNHKIYLFNPDGVLQKTVKIPRLSEFGPSQEHALAQAPDGSLAVADPEGHRVLLYGPEGRLKGWLGRAAAGDQVETFAHPQGLAFLPDGRLAVVDGTLAKVFVIRLVP